MGEAFIMRKGGGSGGGKYASGLLSVSSAGDYEVITGFRPMAIYLYNNMFMATCTFFNADGKMTHAMAQQVSYGGSGSSSFGYIEGLDVPDIYHYGFLEYASYAEYYLYCTPLDDGFMVKCNSGGPGVYWCAVG